ncbi:cell wall-binding repeat-containing protein [Clostridium cochlearium]|uniref:cell wall-binding repeat-containing protein n=1 Tax=Clostridium cochlearium TaxID=1494 RepID=UPI00214A3CDD|nr:cell wall-binding repeat-containing protein [Clostridium cochlearium]MCR1972292.1 cell wall-binding repeat-containing protein [Clostridium cochlearium]
MSKNSHKALASATVMSLVLTSTLAATNVQAAAEVTRMPGADRYTTAQTVAKKSFGKAENVVLVNGLGYADSVSATPFAKLKNAPILLTDAEDKPSADLLATLTELGAKNIYIVGGKGVVTEAMEKELAKNYTVERIGGTSRYETNAEIAKKVIAETKAEKAILVNGQDGYADALSVASVAATKGYPVIFGNKNNVPTVVKDAVKDVKEILAVGGEGVLPDAVIKTVEAKRIAKGADRFDTNLKVLEHFDGDFNFENIFVAAGGDDSTSKFADALVASAAAAKHGAPVVLTGLGANKDNVDKSVKYVKDKMGDNTKVTIVGGTASVSDAIEKDLKGEKESTGRNEVQSIEAVNLNQIKVVFADKVDEDTAEDVSNYELDGERLDEDTAVADLQDGDKVVLITLANKEGQEKEKDLKVRKGVLTEDKSKLVKEKEVKVRFKDTTAPTIKKVESKGNRKVTIEFSEAVFVEGSSKEDALETLAQELEINDETIDKIGFEKDEIRSNHNVIDENKDVKLSELKNSVKAKGTSRDGYYVNKVEYYLQETLPSGTNKLYTPDGKDGEYLADAAGFNVKEKTIDFKVDEVSGKPKVKSVKGGTDGKVFINFDRPMDKKSLHECEIRLNEDPVNADKIELKEGDTQIKLSGVENIRTGSNTIEINDDLKDAYGNKVDDELRITFTASKDEAKPKVNHVLTVDDDTLRIVYSKDVSSNVAKEVDNYTLRDSKGNKVQIEKVEYVSGDTYDLILEDGKKLDKSKYTLEIEDIIDLAGNVMDDYKVTINGSEITPIVNEAVQVKDESKKVVVFFDQEMKSSTINKLDNYKYKDDDGKVRQLPSDAKITTSQDGKAAKIEFPDNYYIISADKSNISKSNIVKSIVVTKNVESSSGIKMDADETHEIKKASDKTSDIKIDEEALTLKKDGNDVVVELKFTGSLDDVEDRKAEDFKFVDSAAKETKAIKPYKAIAKGDYVEFRFRNSGDDKQADLVERIGSDLALEKVGKVTDFAGRRIELSDSDIKDAKLDGVYHNEIAPELSYEKDKGFIEVTKDETNAKDKEWVVNVAEGKITVKFNTRLDERSAHKNDFKFISNKASTLEVDDAKVDGNTIVYTLTKKGREDLQKTGTHEISVTPKDSQRIESKEDKDGNTKKFEPKSTETGEKLKFKVTVEEADKEVDEAAKALKEAKVAVEKAEKSKLQADKDAAKKLVDALKDSTDKTDLLKRIEAIVVEGEEPGQKVKATMKVVQAGVLPGEDKVEVVLSEVENPEEYTVSFEGFEFSFKDGVFKGVVKTGTTVEQLSIIKK